MKKMYIKPVTKASEICSCGHVICASTLTTDGSVNVDITTTDETPEGPFRARQFDGDYSSGWFE